MRFLMAVAFATLFVGSPAFAFEGTIRWRISTGSMNKAVELGAKADDPKSIFAIPHEKLATGADVKESKFALLVKGDRVKEVAEASPDANYVIVDGGERSVWMVTPKEKRYVAWGKNDLAAMEAKAKATDKAQEDALAKLSGDALTQAKKRLDEQRARRNVKPDVKEVGTKEKVLEHEAKVIDVTILDRAARGWVATEPADLAKTFRDVYTTRENLQIGQGGLRDPKSVLTEHGIPLRIITADKGGFRVEEIVAIEPHSVSDAEVGLPTDFTKISIEDLLKQALQSRLNQVKVPTAGPK